MDIPKVVGRLFPPFEVRVTCKNIATFLQADDGLCVDLVKREAFKLARDIDKTMYSIRINHFKPDQLALILIFNVLVRNLEGGSYHVYRGKLGTQGHDMRRLWYKTAIELINRGYCTEEEYAVDLQGLDKEILSMG